MSRLPATSEDFATVRDSWLRKARALPGYVCQHWVTEFTKRGIPHLHAMVFVEGCAITAAMHLTAAWLSIAGKYGAAPQGQHIVPWDERIGMGWLAYVAKHAARGVSNYQRQGAELPEGWAKTGRLWGKGGSWPRQVTTLDVMDDGTFYKMRRLSRSSAVASARREGRRSGKWKRLSKCRRLLKCGDRKVSNVKGFAGFCDGAAFDWWLSVLLYRAGWPVATPETGSFLRWSRLRG